MTNQGFKVRGLLLYVECFIMHLAQYLEYLNELVGAHEHWHHFTLVSKLHKLFLVHMSLLELHVHTKVNFTLAAVKLKHVLQIRAIL